MIELDEQQELAIDFLVNSILEGKKTVALLGGGGCVDMNTEYMTRTGWKKISEYSGEEILQWNKDGSTQWTTPLSYIKNKQSELNYVKTTRFSMSVSDAHRVPYYGNGRDWNIHVKPMSELKEHNSPIIPRTFDAPSEIGVTLSNPLIKVLVMHTADGSITDTKKNVCFVIHVKKQRKIDRATKLLNEANIKFTVTDRKDDFKTFRYYPPKEIAFKSLSVFWSASKEQLKLIADEALHWDGSIVDRSKEGGRKPSQRFTGNKSDVDMIQYAYMAAYNKIASVSKDKREYVNEDIWNCNFLETTNSSIEWKRINKTNKNKILTTIGTKDGYEYCFTTPSSFWLARHEGHVFPTGNSGKSSIIHQLKSRTELKDKSIAFTATTNKAVNVMRETIPETKTLHKTISKYNATKGYADFEVMFKAIKDKVYLEELHSTQELTTFLNKVGIADDFEKEIQQYDSAEELAAEYGYDGYHSIVFSHYSTDDYIGGVCVIDESSMLPSESQYDKEDKLKAIGLDRVVEIYDTVVLVGDGEQLPPIEGEPAFEGVASFELTKNYRSNHDLLKVLQEARDGVKPKDLTKTKALRRVHEAPPGFYDKEKLLGKNAIHIVYRNKTRFNVTKLIRGNNPQPEEGDPIVYKGKSIDNEETGDRISKNEMGVFSNRLGRWDNHVQSVQSRHFDEYNEGWNYLSYGYAITCHTAQGGAWDYVIVHAYDIPSFIDPDDKRKWLYTAMSRAKKGIILVV